MTKKRLIIVVSVVITVVTLAMIWRFSAQDSSETTALSGGLARKIVSWVSGWFGGWGVELNPKSVEAVLRKLAHFGVFMMLGVGLAGMFVWQRRVPVWAVVILIGAMCAAVDEIHQSFVPGRNPAVLDVLIDTLGVCVGMVMVLLVVKKVKK